MSEAIDPLQRCLRCGSDIFRLISVGDFVRLSCKLCEERADMMARTETMVISEFDETNKNGPITRDADIPDCIPVDRLEISIRVWNCMKNSGVKTVGDIRARTRAEWMRVPNFGKVSWEEIAPFYAPGAAD